MHFIAQRRPIRLDAIRAVLIRSLERFTSRMHISLPQVNGVRPGWDAGNGSNRTMQVTIINGAPGVGKTTLLRSIQRRLPPPCAILEGGALARIYPLLDFSMEWINLVHSNLLACAVNQRKAGVRQLLIAFVFPDEKHVRHLDALFRTAGLMPQWIHLVASRDSLLARLYGRGDMRREIHESSPVMSESIRRMAHANHQVCIDTSDLEAEAVCAKVLAAITGQAVEEEIGVGCR